MLVFRGWLIVSCFLMLGLTALAQNSEQIKINTSYDRFKDQTTIETDMLLIGGLNMFEGVFMKPMMVANGSIASSKQIILAFAISSIGKAPEYDDPELLAIADGQRLNLGKLVQQPVTRPLGLESSVFAKPFVTAVTFEAFRKLAFAKKVELRIADKEAELKPAHLEAMRRLIVKCETRN